MSAKQDSVNFQAFTSKERPVVGAESYLAGEGGKTLLHCAREKPLRAQTACRGKWNRRGGQEVLKCIRVGFYSP